MTFSNIINFLEELKDNNSKEWFDINRKRYEKLRKEFLEFVKTLIFEISTFDNEVAYLQPKDCIFRINKDIRFSKDKSPYKTNFGAYIVKNGKKSGNAGYYFHIEPDNFFLAGGIYAPKPENLKEIRLEIYNNPDKFLKLINNKDFKDAFGEIWGEKLTNVPRGFDKNFEYADLLKYKSYVSFRNLSSEEVCSVEILEILKKYFKITYDFNTYLNSIINM